MIELVLIAPWFVFLFIGALDWGFFSSALITAQAALRSAVLYTSSDPNFKARTDLACNIVLDEMRKLPNIGSSVTVCGSGGTSTMTSNPAVLAEAVTGPDGASASKVTLTYRSVSVIPIPGILAKQFTFSRNATMRIRI
jgi:TadE-like protein